ncbi:DEAD/DEAH box helicase [Gammaproteobacteria bacterium]
MIFAPHAYQARAIGHVMDSPGCLLALDMGLGKTAITLTALAQLLHGFDVSRCLVIAPKRVAENTWPAEAAKWEHTKTLRVSVALGSEKQRQAALDRDADLYIINTDNVPWLVAQYKPDAWPFDLVVLDESTRFKDQSTQRFKALRRVLGKINKIVLLSGTPAPQGPMDLWAQLYLIDRGQRLGRSFSGFRNRYFTSDYMGYKWEPRPGAQEGIEKAVADVVLSMQAADWLDMPEVVVVDVPVELPRDAMKTYRKLERDCLAELESATVTAMSAAALCNKLTQCASGFLYDEFKDAHVIHEVKLDALEDLIEAAGGPAMLAYAYKFDRERISRRFPQAVEVREPGAVDRWNRGGIPLLLAHPASAGHGLNLQQGGRHLIWYGLPWSLELYLQTNARLHRQGQREAVIIHRIIATGTIDERIARVLSDKKTGLDALMSALRG